MYQFSRLKQTSLRGGFFRSKMFLVVILAIVLVGVLFWGGILVSGLVKDQLPFSDNRIKLPDAKATITLNKEKQFPIKNDKGEELAKLKFVIENAELRDQLVVKGKKATAVKGRTFLVVNLKITNDYSKAIEINTRDYIRLSVNGNENEWMAADMHNDPVAIQASSTKNTRLAFPINESDKNLKLRFGEIKGEKETIDLKF